MATQSENADDQSQKQMKLAAAMLEQDADCTRILSRDCPEMGVDPRKPLLVHLCEQHSSLLEDVRASTSHITEWLAAGAPCDHSPTKSHKLYLYDVAAARGDIDVLCLLPALYDDIVPRDQFTSTGEESQHTVTQQPDDEVMMSHLFAEGSFFQPTEEMVTPQKNDRWASSPLEDEVTSQQPSEGVKHPQTHEAAMKVTTSDEMMTSVSFENGNLMHDEKVADISDTSTGKRGPDQKEASLQHASQYSSAIHDMRQKRARLRSGHMVENMTGSLQNVPGEGTSRNLPTKSADRSFTERIRGNAAESDVYKPCLCKKSENDGVTNPDRTATCLLRDQTHEHKVEFVSDLQHALFQDEEIFFDASDVLFFEDDSVPDSQRAYCPHGYAKENAVSSECRVQPKRAEEYDDDEEIFADAVETLDTKEDKPERLTCEDVKEKEVPIKSQESPFLAKETSTLDDQISDHRGQSSSCPKMNPPFPDSADALGSPQTSTSLVAASAAAAEHFTQSAGHGNRACRHTDTHSCSSRRKIVLSAVRQYVQRHFDLHKLVPVLKCQPCTEDVVGVFDALENSPETQAGLLNVVQEFGHVIGAHSGRSPHLSACRVNSEASAQASSMRTDTDICEMSMPSSLNKTDTDIGEMSMPSSLNKTDTDICETSVQSLQNPTGTDFCETSVQSLQNPTGTDFCETPLTQTDTDVGARAVEDPVSGQHLSPCEEDEDSDLRRQMTQCVRRYQQAQAARCADIKMFPAVNCPGSFSEGPGVHEEDHQFIRKSQSRLCQLMWSAPELCQAELEALSPLFDQEITMDMCSNSCRRVLFPEFLGPAGHNIPILFEHSCQSNRDLFQCIETGKCLCTWVTRNTVVFLPACPAAAAGNMDLFRRMLQAFVTRVEMTYGAGQCGSFRSGKSALKKTEGGVTTGAVPKGRRVLRFNTSLTTFHSDRLLAQALRHALYANQSREVLRVLDDPRVQRVIPLKDDAKMSLMDLALRLGDDDTFMELLDRFGPDIQGDPDGLTPLLLVVSGGRTDLARIVLARGARRGAENNEGRNALELALHWNEAAESDKMALMLLEEGEGQTDPDNPRIPAALELAIIHKCYALLDYLVERGHVAVPEVFGRRKAGQMSVEPTWCPAVCWCCVRGNHFTVAKYLIEKGLDCLTSVAQHPNTVNSDSRTPLQAVAVWKHDEALSLLDVLIEKGADVNDKSLKGFTPLVIAMKASNLKALGKLISAGAILDSPQMAGCMGNGSDGAALNEFGSASTQSGSGFSSSAAGNGSGSSLSPLQQSLRSEETKNSSLLWHALQTRHFQVAEMAVKGGYRVYREAWYVKGEFPGTTPQEVTGNLERLSRQPLTLLSLCRRRLRESLGSRLSVFLRDARLPQAVADFIAMKDLVDMYLK